MSLPVPSMLDADCPRCQFPLLALNRWHDFGTFIVAHYECPSIHPIIVAVLKKEESRVG